MTKNLRKQIEDMKCLPQSEYENNTLIWQALDKLAQAIDNIIQYGKD